MDENQRQDWWPDEHPTDTPQNPEQHTQPEENAQAQEPTWQELYPNNGNSTSDNYWNQYNQQNFNNQQNPYNQPNPGYYPQRHMNNSMAIASLVMGILSIVLICCGFSFFFGALGILFALLSRKEAAMDPQAKIGLGLSIGGTVMSLVLIIVVLAGNSSYYSDFIKEYQRFYNEYEDEPLFDPENLEDSYPDMENFGNWNFEDGDWYFEEPDSGDSL